MINVSKILKDIMEEYSLNQTQLSRAVNCDYSNVSRWVNSVRTPDIETIENILSPFGYKLNVELVKKTGKIKAKDFYLEKSYNQLSNMSEEELVDYVFVTQDEGVLANVCGVTEEILKCIPLEKQRELITKNMSGINRLELYFKIIKKYSEIEKEMAYFIEHAKYHLENLSNVPKDILKEAEYLVFNVEVHNAMYDDEYFTLYNLRLLDKNRSLLDVSSDDIYGYDMPLDDSLDNNIGDYYFDECDGINAEIKLNY